MNREEKLAEEIARIQKLAAENPGVDANLLIERLLAREQQSSLPAKETTKAYMLSLLVPPLGIYYAFKFFFRPEPVARRAAWICLILTALSLFILWALGNTLFSAAPQLQQIQNLTPQQIQDLTQ